MSTYRRMTLAFLAVACTSVCFAGSGRAGEPRPNVIGEVDIQAQIDQRMDNERGDRQAVQDLLRRPDVRRIAGAAGLDMTRATAAAATLSGPELKEIATRAHELNAGVGGKDTITLSVTAVIIILLLILILTR